MQADSDAPLREEIFDVLVAQIDSILAPDGVGKNIWREKVAFISFNHPAVTVNAACLGPSLM